MKTIGSTLEGAEIFESGGPWNGLYFTDADLDGIVSSFQTLGLAGHVPLKWGHQGQDARTDGEPALGWVQKVYRQGSKLMADFTNVSNAVMEAIRSGAYRFVSVELLKNVMAGNRKIPWILDAVALLGATPPAVGTLSPLKASRTAFNFEDMVSFTRPQETDEDMETKEQFAALSRRYIALLFENAIRSGAALPRDREQFARRFPGATVEDAEAFLRDTPKPPKLDRATSLATGGSTVIPGSGRADFRVLEAAERLVIERRQAGKAFEGQTFEQLLQAAKAVFKADPTLAREWADQPGER